MPKGKVDKSVRFYLSETKVVPRDNSSSFAHNLVMPIGRGFLFNNKNIMKNTKEIMGSLTINNKILKVLYGKYIIIPNKI